MQKMKYYCAGIVFLAGVAPLSVGAQEKTTGAQVSSSGQHAHDKEIVTFTDERAPIVLNEAERAFLKREMRGFLAGVQEILEAAAAGDGRRVAGAARNVGMNGPEQDHIPKSLAPKLPLEFKKLGLATHRGFDEIAAAASAGAADRISQQVGVVMRNCVACHGAWRIVVEGAK